MAKPAYTISAENNTPLILLDADVAAGATARSLVYLNGENTPACAIELRVTLLGAAPVNLAIRPLGQNTTPAADPTRLLPLNVALPNTSALAANYAAMFAYAIYSEYGQFEVENISGGPVHVTATIQGCLATFLDTPAASGATSVQLAAGSADAGTFHLATGAVVALATAAQTALDTLAGAIASGNIKAILQAGSAAFGKLAANSGVNIGSVDVLTLPSLVLAAGANAIGKLAANVGVNIGLVDIGALGIWIDTVASADITAHAYPTSQVVKAPVFVRAQRTMQGTVTISDGTRPGMVLAAGDPMPLHCTNLNQITYTFSLFNATTEKFSISAGI